MPWLSDRTDKLDDDVCIIFCQDTRSYNVYIMQRSDWYLSHPCQFLLSVISLGLCPVILQSLTILISFSLMPVSPPLGKHSWCMVLGGRVLSWAACVPFQEHSWVTGGTQVPTSSWSPREWSFPPECGAGSTTSLCGDMSLVPSAVGLCSWISRQQVGQRVRWFKIFILWGLWGPFYQGLQSSLQSLLQFLHIKWPFKYIFPLPSLWGELYEEF